MLLSHRYNFLFVHIAKTGGTSVRDALDRLRWQDPKYYPMWLCSRLSALFNHELACKLPRHAKAIAAQIEATEAELMRNGSGDAEAVAKRLRAARRAFLDVVDFVAGNSKASPNAVYAGSVTYLLLAGNLVAGWQLGRALLIAQEQIAEGKDVDFMKAKIATARFYADHILSRVPGQRDSVVDGADSVTALALEAF